MTPRNSWTVGEVRALPGYGYELIDGQLYAGGMIVPDNDLAAFTPPPPIAPSLLHQRVCAEFLEHIGRYAAEQRVGEAVPVDSEVTIVAGLVGQPDIVVVPFHDGRRVLDWPRPDELLLVVAVASARSAYGDRGIDPGVYRRAGVAEYWAVDVDAGAIDRWRPDEQRAEIAADVIEWRPPLASSRLRIDLEALFARVREVVAP